jgi:hypothetical protein
VAEEEDNLKEDLYVAQAAVLPGCLAPDLLHLSRDPVAAWRLLHARAAELGLLESCSALWRLLRALSSGTYREDTCVTLDLVDGNVHFVISPRSTLETVLPALAVSIQPPWPTAPPADNDVGTASLAAALEAATRPAAQKVVRVEDKWLHSYGRLLLLTGAARVGELHEFWHDYADQKKAQPLGLRAIRGGGHGQRVGPRDPHRGRQDHRSSRLFGPSWGQ